MIAYLSGTVKYKEESAVILDVSGVGYEVRMCGANIVQFRIGDDVELFIHFQVSEKEHTLFGFATNGERALFRLLLTVSGVGPKSALGILEKAGAKELIQALIQSNASALRTFGIGAKTAERLVVELSGKVHKLEVQGAGESGPFFLGDADVIEALKGLGYSLAEARDAARSIPQEMTSVSDRVKHALRFLSTR